MDTALFYRERLGLSEKDAFERVKIICDHATDHGGVVTVNWHHRSIGPERFWDDFYICIIEELKKQGAWFTTAGKAVSWFQKRRALVFQKVETIDSAFVVKIACDSDSEMPGFILRVHNLTREADQYITDQSNRKKRDLIIQGDVDIIIPIE
jgi:hypothetical protein